MAANQLSSGFIERSGICRLPLELILLVCDHLGNKDMCRLSMANRYLRASIEFELYVKTTRLYGKYKVKWARPSMVGDSRVINLFAYGIDRDWNTNSMRLIINACVQAQPSLLDGWDTCDCKDWHGILCCKSVPPLFRAVKKNRQDIVSLMEEGGADMNIKHFMPNARSRRRRREQDLCRPTKLVVDYFGPELVLELAAQYRNLELVEKLLANPKILVRPDALSEAVFGSWEAGVRALMGCGRLEQVQIADVLNKALHECFAHDQPDQIKFLISIGADPHYQHFYRGWESPNPFCHGRRCNLHYPSYCVPYCTTLLPRSILAGKFGNAERLLEIFPFSEDYMIHTVRVCASDDYLLHMTMFMLRRVDGILGAKMWVEAYAAAIRRFDWSRGTCRSLLDYGHDLLRAHPSMDFNKETIAGTGSTLLFHVLESYYSEKYEFLEYSSRFDGVFPLFDLGVNPASLSARGWKLFFEYLCKIRSKEKPDRILSLCRRKLSPKKYQAAQAVLFSVEDES